MTLLWVTIRTSCIVLLVPALLHAIELTFELPDNANQCFYEELKAGTESVIEYQVRSFHCI